MGAGARATPGVRGHPRVSLSQSPKPSGCSECHAHADDTMSSKPWADCRRAACDHAPHRSTRPRDRQADGGQFVRYGTPDRFLRRRQNFEDRRSNASAEIDCRRVAAVFQKLKRLEVGLGQVEYVHVVTNSCAVGGGIVGAEHLQRTPTPECCLHDERHEIESHRPVLSDGSVQPGSCGIEIPQTDRVQPETAVIPRHDSLDDRLALAIGAFRANSGVLSHGEFVGRAVDRTARREDQPHDAELCHCFEQSRTSGDVVMEIPPWPLHGFTGRLVRSKMHHCVDVVFSDHSSYNFSVSDVRPYEWSVTQGGSMAELQCVEHDDVPAAFP